MLRTTYGCFDLAPEFFKIDHFTVLELKFSDSTYITNQPSYSHMTVVPVIGAKLQIGAGLHGRLFYRITPTRLYKQPDVQTITGFLSDDFDLLDEHYLELASEPIEKFIEIARSWLINNDYIFEV
ncbi:hypothetical protein [Flavitalea sp.]|nr:hypothetical protein [Flavitalea sp.]